MFTFRFIFHFYVDFLTTFTDNKKKFETNNIYKLDFESILADVAQGYVCPTRVRQYLNIFVSRESKN